VFGVPGANRLPPGIEYVLPGPGVPLGLSSGLIRMILPLRSFEFADVRWASQNVRPGRSSIGAKPSEANGFVLSPAEM